MYDKTTIHPAPYADERPIRQRGRLDDGTIVVYTGSLRAHHGLYRAYACLCRRCEHLAIARYNLVPTGATRTPSCGGDPKCVRRSSLTTLED
jgi:hypothetical protein